VTESRRGSGTFVIDRRKHEGQGPAAETIPLESIGEFLAELEFRIVVESETAYLASLRRGPDDLKEMLRLLDEFERALSSGAEIRKCDFLFHRTIARATGNSQFVRALEQVNQSSSSTAAVARHRLHFRPLDRGLAVLHEHRDIYDLIKAQDAEAARRAMKNHLERARIWILGTAST
jgi:DNA-binding FadR family transcriptional regulator